MYQLVFTNRFKKDTKILLKRGFPMELLKQAIIALEKRVALISVTIHISYPATTQATGTHI